MKRAIGIVVIALVVAASAVAYWRFGMHAGQADDVPELLLYAPPDAKAIVYVDEAALRSSAFESDLAAIGPARAPEREYLDFVQATGFDFSRDLDRAVLIFRQQAPGDVGLAVAEGRFDKAKIKAYALRTGKLAHLNGLEIYEVPQAAPAAMISVTFLDGNHIALAQGNAARATLEAIAQKGKQAALDPAMRERVVRVSGSPIFAVGQLDKLPANLSAGGMRSDQLSALGQNIRWATLGVRPDGETLHLVAEAECETQENAHQLAGTLDGLQMLGQGMMSDPKTRTRIDPQVVALLDSALRNLHVSQDGMRVRLIVQLTQAELRSVLASPSSPARR
jgi:hypothetical protein